MDFLPGHYLPAQLDAANAWHAAAAPPNVARRGWIPDPQWDYLAAAEEAHRASLVALERAILLARDEGRSWASIGRTLGVRKQSAQARWEPRIRDLMALRKRMQEAALRDRAEALRARSAARRDAEVAGAADLDQPGVDELSDRGPRPPLRHPGSGDDLAREAG